MRCLRLLMLAAVLVGCGSSTSTITSHVSARTHAGVRYSYEVTMHQGRECSTQTYGILASRAKPSFRSFTQTSRSCAPSGRPAGAILIQIRRPRTAFILDRPSRGCAAVRITAAGRRPIVAAPICSATKPTLRLTPLPSGRVLTIAGIAGVTRLVLGDYRCPFICSQRIGTAI